MQQRYYDPAIGRFLSVDPMASDMQIGWNFNRYNYAANSPYTFVDPDGREIAFIGTSAERWLLHESLRKVEASNPASAARAQLLRDWPNLHTVRFPVSGEAPQNKTTGIMANDSNGVGTGSESIVDPTATTNTFNSDGTPAAISGEAALAHEFLGHGGDKDKGVVDRRVNPSTGERRSEESAMDADGEYQDAVYKPRRDCHSDC